MKKIMNKKALSILFSLAIVCSLFFSAYPAVSVEDPKVVLMSWDGVERIVFYELLNQGLLPNIAMLNVYNLTCNEEYDAWTVTEPQHAIMLSGYLANVTGTTRNSYGDWTPLGDLSVFVRVKNIRPEIYIAGYIAKTKNLSPILLSPSPDRPQGKILGIFWNKNGFNKVLSLGTMIAPPRQTLREGAYATGSKGNILRKLAGVRTSFFYFFHLADPDAYGHRWGVNSNKYRKGIKDCDKLLGELVDKLPEETVFIITSDHGFGTNGDEYGHKGCPNTFIASNGNLRNGFEVDVAPTIYELLGINPAQFEPELDGVSLLE